MSIFMPELRQTYLVNSVLSEWSSQIWTQSTFSEVPVILPAVCNQFAMTHRSQWHLKCNRKYPRQTHRCDTTDAQRASWVGIWSIWIRGGKGSQRAAAGIPAESEACQRSIFPADEIIYPIIFPAHDQMLTLPFPTLLQQREKKKSDAELYCPH